MALKGKTIVLVGGARPNFMKLGPLYVELKKRGVRALVVNAGQHADASMNANFFKEFGMKPYKTLRPSRESSTEQFADMVRGLGRAFADAHPELVVVVGDVNATLAGAIAARLAHIPVAHVEAGLRSGNARMAEERNRILVDRLSQLLFVTEESGIRNLKAEGVPGKAHLVGNIMLDAVRSAPPYLPMVEGKYYFVTLHRAENVDRKEVFEQILDALEVISKDAPLCLPLHPRTEARAREFGLLKRIRSIFTILPPLSHRETVGYQRHAALVLTDSGGIQEETTFLGVPCLTLRDETERPITVERGTNIIAGTTTASILKAYRGRRPKKGRSIRFWDGRAAKRIADVLEKELEHE